MSGYYSNLKVSHISNKDLLPYESLICSVCLEIAMTPLECSNCGILICYVCQELLKLIGKECVKDRCRNTLKKANKYVRGALSLIILTCSYCDMADIKYDDYAEHLKNCLIYCELDHIKNYKKLIGLEEEIKSKTKEKEALIRKINHPDYSKDISTFITGILKPAEKLELYNATIEGNIPLLKQLLVDKQYPIFEEISQTGFKWTPLHYAMHYGKIDVITFLLDIIVQKGILINAMKLTSSDGRCPILCLLKSNNLQTENKKSILKTILKTYKIKVSDTVMAEIRKRNMGDVLEN